jgi:endonuclease YncB( thermonuclease family)
MQFLPCLLLLLVPVSAAAPAGARPIPRDPVLVRAVVSGDTIDVVSVGRVRLLGIRAPRLSRVTGGSEPFAVDARSRLASLLVNRWVRLEPGPASLAARVQSAYVMTEDGQFVNALMVREGLARVVGGAAPGRGHDLVVAESEARASGQGVWGSGTGHADVSGTQMQKPSRRARRGAATVQ